MKGAGMSDGQKALYSAGVFTAMFVGLVAIMAAPIIRGNSVELVSGSLRCGLSPISAFLVLVLGVFLVFFFPLLWFWREIYLRRTGQMLARAHGEVQRGMPGLEAIRERVK